MNWVYYLLLLAMLVVGLGIVVMNLPGLWLMAAAAGLYSLLTPEHYLFPWGIVTILVLCLVGEVLEFFGKAGGAKQAGGSGRAMLLATIGGVVGGIVLTIPVPIIGTIAGGCFGAFVGALAGQMTVAGDVEHSTRVGWGAAKGTLVGILLKLFIGVVIVLLTAWLALPISRTRASAPPTTSPPPPASAPSMPSTLPAAQPTTMIVVPA
jgi:uncharacterized protein YqgC (DUF456 family)